MGRGAAGASPLIDLDDIVRGASGEEFLSPSSGDFLSRLREAETHEEIDRAVEGILKNLKQRRYLRTLDFADPLTKKISERVQDLIDLEEYMVASAAVIAPPNKKAPETALFKELKEEWVYDALKSVSRNQNILEAKYFYQVMIENCMLRAAKSTSVQMLRVAAVVKFDNFCNGLDAEGKLIVKEIKKAYPVPRFGSRGKLPPLLSWITIHESVLAEEAVKSIILEGGDVARAKNRILARSIFQQFPDAYPALKAKLSPGSAALNYWASCPPF
jgi:hypothetical protein